MKKLTSLIEPIDSALNGSKEAASGTSTFTLNKVKGLSFFKTYMCLKLHLRLQRVLLAALAKRSNSSACFFKEST